MLGAVAGTLMGALLPFCGQQMADLSAELLEPGSGQVVAAGIDIRRAFGVIAGHLAIVEQELCRLSEPK